jgi:hypothetical protein
MSEGHEPTPVGAQATPAERSGPTGVDGEPERANAKSPTPPEPYGPLQVDRRRKEDGRVVILYSRAAGTAGGAGG